MGVDGVKVLYLSRPSDSTSFYDSFIHSVGRRYLVEAYDPDVALAEQFEGTGVVVDAGGTFGTREMIDAASAANVRLWQTTTNGLDEVDVAYFLKKGVPLANAPGPLSAVALAEHALFLMLCCAKRLHAGQRNVRSKVSHQPVHDELAGKTLGLVGLGASGRELAQRAWAMGMRIMAVDVADVPPAVLDQLHVTFLGDPEQLERVLAEADYVSLHVPLTTRTRHMIDRRALELMKPTAVLINVARGAIVDEAALIEALRTGQIGGAGLDVVTEEPIDPAHPFLQMDNVVLTPHFAAATHETRHRRAKAAAENVARVAQGLPPLYLVTAVE